MARGRKGFLQGLTVEKVATAMAAIEQDPFVWARAPKRSDQGLWTAVLKLLGLARPGNDCQNILWTWFHLNRKRAGAEHGLQVLCDEKGV